MNVNESRTIRANASDVWAALLDGDVLKNCIPGCQELTGSVEDGFHATVVQKVGPVKATFRGHVTLTDLVQNESVVIDGEGKGGAAGFAKGSAHVTLTEERDVTILTYGVEAKVGGKLAQLGGRIIDGFARKMANKFFENFEVCVGRPHLVEEKASEPVQT